MHLHKDGFPWYALHVRRRFEKVVAETLRSRGYEQFLPFNHRERRSSDRVTQIELPLFPGYVFCRFELANRLQILTVPGVNAVVGFGRHFAPIEASQLEAIRTVLKSGRPCELVPFVATGNRVRVESGPLADAEGFITSTNDRSRFVVSITVLERSVSVPIEHESLKALPEPVGAPQFQNRKILVS